MAAAHLAAVNQLIEEIQPLVTRIVDGQADLEGCTAAYNTLNVTCNQLLVKAADHYADAVAQAALRVTNALSRNQWSDFIRTAKRDGWLLAGTWYYKLTQLSEHVTEAVRNTPRVIPMEIEDRLATEHLDEVGPKLEKVKAYVSKQAWYGDLQAVGSPDPLDDPNGNFLQNIINQGFKYVLSWITTSWAGNGDVHPILEAKTLGDYIIGIGEALMVILGAGS